MLFYGCLLFLLAGCMHPPEPFTTRRLLLARNETVQLPQIGLTITNRGCGRQWEGDAERPYCDLELRSGDSIYRFADSFAPLYIRNIEIRMDKMNPWNVVEDSVPPGGCRLIVTKGPDSSR